MTSTTSSEYQQLERESSNLLMEWDGRWVLGRYAEAAQAALRAGLLRLRMGNLCVQIGDFSQGAVDWLSAAAACLRATNVEFASMALRHVRDLQENGALPSDRVDIARALRERESDRVRLEEAIRSFGTAMQAHGGNSGVPDPAALAFLLQSVPQFPGLAVLHYSIARQAAGLGRQDLADTHLFWATVFDPLNEAFFTHLAFTMIRSGRVKDAQKLSEEFLSRSQDAGFVRVLLAIAIASDATAREPELERSAAVLDPLTGPACADALVRALALAVSVEVRRALGQTEQVARRLKELTAMEQCEGDPEVRVDIAGLRAALSIPPPTVSAANGGARNGSPHHDLLRLAELLLPFPA